MFDAGAIEARLTIRLDQFDKDMDKAEARVRKLTDTRHEIKLTAVFDTSTMGRARQLFAQLDNQLSRDAANRLRSSPQGSVLGTLNSLFSPHPVTGSPSAAQSGTQGALGKIVNTPNTVVTKTSAVTRQNTVIDTVLGIDDRSVKAKAATAGKDAADAAVKGATDEAAKKGSSWLGGLLSFSRTSQSKAGGGGAGAVSGLLGGIGPGILGLSTKTAGIVGLGGSILGALPALFGGVAPLIPAAVGAGALGALFKGAQSQISPVSQGITQAQQALATAKATPNNAAGIQSAQAALTAANAQLGQLSPALRSIYQSEQTIGNWWQGFTSRFAPMFAGPLSQVAKLLTSLQGPLNAFFGQAFKVAGPIIAGLGDIVKSVLPGLTQGFAAAAPVIRPLLDGIGMLVGNLLPGLNTLIKASAPAVAVLAQVFGTLGKDLGGLLSAFAPVLKQSAVIFKALFDVVGALFPIVGQLAAIFATALAPVFVQFAAVVKSLLPFLIIVGKILSSLAGAVIGDLVSAFGALAQILIGVAPSLNKLGGALSQVFNTLENKGAFAQLGDIIEGLAAPIANLINALITGLLPVLPNLINTFTTFVNLLSTIGVQVVAGVIPPLTTLAVILGKVLDAVPPQVLSDVALGFLALGGAMKILNAIGLTASLTMKGLAIAMAEEGLAAKVAGVAQAVWAGATKVAAVVGALFTGALDLETLALRGMYLWDTVVAVATKAWAIAQAILNVALDANPIGLIIIAIAALAAGVFELYTHWSTVWGFIKKIAADAWNFIFNGFGKYLLPLLGPVGLLVLGIIEVWQHWGTILGLLKKYVIGDFIAPVVNSFLDLISFLLHGVVDAFGWIPGLGGQLQNAAKAFDTFRQQVNQSLANITRSVDVNLNTSGSGSIVISGTGITTRTINTSTGQVSTVGGHTLSAGAFISKGAGGKVDDQPAMLARGELVVPSNLVAAGMVNHLRGLIPGFSAGGVVGTPIRNAGQAIGQADVMWGQLAAVAFAQSALKAVQSAVTAVNLTGLNLPPGSGGTAMAYAASILPPGWSWPDLVALWTQESGWNPYAVNPTSGAYGIPQALPAVWGHPYALGDFVAQIRWGLNYIAGRYGNSQGAWAHEQAFNWYGNGGPINEPVLGWGSRTGKRYVFGEKGPEWVVPASQMGGGHGGSSKIADTINIMQPEGLPLSAALNELEYKLHAARMGGYIGRG